MDNKKTTVFLAILLAILIALMFLRAYGIGPWALKVSQNNNFKQAEIENIENSAAEKDTGGFDVAVDSDHTVDVDEIVPQEEEPKPEPVPEELKPEPAADKPKPEPAQKPKTAPQQKTPKADLTKPASEMPAKTLKKEKITTFTNRSGFKPFFVYTDIGAKENNYKPYAFMGDVQALNINQGYKVNPRFGKTCIKVTYDPSRGKVGWSGVYWTEPANNWGDQGPGFNLTGAERLSFWARGEKGGETISNFLMGGIRGKKYEDSDSRSIGPIELSQEWTQYYISLVGADLTNIIGGFCFTITEDNNPDGAIFYLDNIVYE
ncbi:MAG: hypothetical protein FWG57_05935 [Endomicrobia bacterium]|nr:hypothetical protein [Endomicrobiia bacterium]